LKNQRQLENKKIDPTLVVGFLFLGVYTICWKAPVLHLIQRKLAEGCRTVFIKPKNIRLKGNVYNEKSLQLEAF
jgi:hypothetical protein